MFAKILESILELERTISWKASTVDVYSLSRENTVHRLQTNLHEFNLFAVNSDRVSKTYLKITAGNLYTTFSIGKESTNISCKMKRMKKKKEGEYFFFNKPQTNSRIKGKRRVNFVRD